MYHITQVGFSINDYYSNMKLTRKEEEVAKSYVIERLVENRTSSFKEARNYLNKMCEQMEKNLLKIDLVLKVNKDLN